MLDIDQIRRSENVAELLDDSELHGIAQQVIQGYEVDEDSRGEWMERVLSAMEIAKQTMETKNTPFPNASNVKYPLISQASIDFAARLYPELVHNDRVVRTVVVGQDPDGSKLAMATRVSMHMSYQFLNEIEGWEDGLDKMLHILPVVGTVFKKIYYDPATGLPCSELCTPDKICVNYNTGSLNGKRGARRVTHILSFSKNDIVERVRRGFYRDIDLDDIVGDSGRDAGSDLASNLLRSTPGIGQDSDGIIELLEQHCYLDLDGDGYAEPYVVTVHRDTMTVLRVVHRFAKIERNIKGQVICIEPEEYFQDYHFLRSPDGGFYSIGLGTLLYPLNASINTLINQLIDAGTMSNSQGGIIGKGLRMRGGSMTLAFNEWKMVEAAPGQSLRDNVFPWPTKEPSPTLFQLLGLLIQCGKDMIYTTEALKGQGQTQNVAASTVMAMIEQGLKVYNAIAKRLYRGLMQEYQKVAEINAKHLTQKQYMTILDDPAANVKVDYDLRTVNVLPIADPSMASLTQRLAKAQAIFAVPGVDPRAAGVLYLQALQLSQGEIMALLPPPDPNAPPPPEDQRTLAQAQLFLAQAQAAAVEPQLKAQDLQLKGAAHSLREQEMEVFATEALGRVQKMQHDSAVSAAKVEQATFKTSHKAMLDENKLDTQRAQQMIDATLETEALKIEADKVARMGNKKDA